MRPAHCLSIDLEDWFHFLDVEETACVEQWQSFEGRVEQMTLPLLDFFDKHGQKATFFVLGWIAERYPDLVLEVARRGHEVACHSYAHPLIYKLSPNEFERDLVKALECIFKACGVQARAFRAPGFSINARSLWAFDLLSKHGIEVDSSIFPALRSHGGLPTAPARPFLVQTAYGPLTELPISCIEILGKRLIFSGGGYFRLCPAWFVKRAFARAERLNEPVMTYFHPRDFFSNQPQLAMSAIRRFRANINLSKSFTKLGTLFQNFRFGTVTAYTAQLHAADLPSVSLAKKRHMTFESR
jgi:polysaccharide deacetylase family protein (PEP-CTERM system associated)